MRQIIGISRRFQRFFTPLFHYELEAKEKLKVIETKAEPPNHQISLMTAFSSSLSHKLQTVSKIYERKGRRIKADAFGRGSISSREFARRLLGHTSSDKGTPWLKKGPSNVEAATSFLAESLK